MGRGEPIYDWPIPDHRHRIAHFVGKDFLFLPPLVSAFQFVKGFSGAPSGGRLSAGVQAVRANTLRVVGSVAAFSAVWSATECAVFAARGGKEDGWNLIAGRAAARGFKYIRQGAFYAARAGLVGGSAVAVVYGVLHATVHWDERRTSPCRRTPVKSGPLAPVSTEPQLHPASRSSAD